MKKELAGFVCIYLLFFTGCVALCRSVEFETMDHAGNVKTFTMSVGRLLPENARELVKMAAVKHMAVKYRITASTEDCGDEISAEWKDVFAKRIDK